MLNDTTIEKFKTTLRGELIQRSDERYDEARKLWNGMFDRRPALIARCAGTADVMSAVNFARDNGVTGGGARRRPQLPGSQKPLRGEARGLIARLGCVIEPAALRIVENDLRE